MHSSYSGCCSTAIRSPGPDMPQPRYHAAVSTIISILRYLPCATVPGPERISRRPNYCGSSWPDVRFLWIGRVEIRSREKFHDILGSLSESRREKGRGISRRFVPSHRPRRSLCAQKVLEVWYQPASSQLRTVRLKSSLFSRSLSLFFRP